MNQLCKICGKAKVKCRGMCSTCYEKYRTSELYKPYYPSCIGEKYNKVTILDLAGKDQRHNTLVKCKCDCGNEFITKLSTVKHNRCKSCGCSKKEYAKQRFKENIIHDETGGYFSNTYVKVLNNKLRKNNTSGVRGVYFNTNAKKYHAQITIQGNKIHLGLYDNIEDAKNARLEAENKYFKPLADEWNLKYSNNKSKGDK